MNKNNTETVVNRPMVTLTVPLTEAEKYATETDPQQIGEHLRAQSQMAVEEKLREKEELTK